MTLSRETREMVRQRADFACEFCGITETDAGGELTIDHYHPIARGGKDEHDNLIYCCSRCNLYKLAYFPEKPGEPVLWNPRKESFSEHFIELETGNLHPLTPVGEFTISRLRLNRPPLIAYRLRKQQLRENLRLLTQYKELIQLQEQINRQLSLLIEEQQWLLKEQQQLLQLLMRKKK